MTSETVVNMLRTVVNMLRKPKTATSDERSRAALTAANRLADDPNVRDIFTGDELRPSTVAALLALMAAYGVEVSIEERRLIALFADQT